MLAARRAPQSTVFEELQGRLSGTVQRDLPIAPHTSFNVGGPADLWIEPRDTRDLVLALKTLQQFDWNFRVIGNGTNCLVADRGIRGAVICMMKGFKKIEIVGSGVLAEAGVSMPLLSQQTARAGLTGYEWACGVPGSIGGSIAMNAGAHAGDTAGVVTGVHLVRPAGAGGWIDPKELEFSYRHSRLSDEPGIVTAARFEFASEDPVTIQNRLLDFREKRRRAQPATSQCAGSIFRNPDGVPAGRLLESLGAKGRRVGGAEVSLKHANFIVNAGGATAADVRTLIQQLQDLALSESGIWLKTEVLLVGDWDEDDPRPRSAMLTTSGDRSSQLEAGIPDLSEKGGVI